MATTGQTSPDLRYPIGKFSWTGPNTDADRKRYIDILAEAPAKLRAAVAGLNEQQLNTPYREGGWTVSQTVHHVADSHMNAYIRWKLALTEDFPTVKTYDEAAWAEMPDSKLPIEVSLDLYERVHQRLVLIMRAMKPEEFQRKLMHPDLGEVVLDRYVAMYAWHAQHHVAHITELRKKMSW